MKVMKFGGASLKNAEGFLRVAEIVKDEKDKKIVVLSGIYGVTDDIWKYLVSGKKDEKSVKKLVRHLYNLHIKVSSETINDQNVSREVQAVIGKKLEKLERLLRGVAYVEELTDRTRDLILSYGERLSVSIFEGVLNALNVEAKALESDSIGIITDGDFGNATAVLPDVTRNVQKEVLPLVQKNIIPVITGFFGCDLKGFVTTFGFNGSDYSASIMAHAVDAGVVEIWKDVDGFMSADPCIVNDAHLIDRLSYREAAELAYFGAKILHPRAVDPLVQKNIPIKIKNTFNPGGNGTEISKNGCTREELVKSVSYSKDIAVIKIHGSGIGSKPGVLSEIVSYISSQKINIKSVITSQTCINLLVDKNDLDQGYTLLAAEKIKTVEKLEKVRDVALIGVVGEGILSRHGIAARVFSVVADKGINVEMISAGASEVAYYFLVKEKFLNPAVVAIHEEIFG